MEREKEEDLDRQQEERERGSASSRFLILRGKREQNRAEGGSAAQQQLSITLYSSPARRSRSVGRPVVIGGVISSLDITFALAPARSTSGTLSRVKSEIK